MERIIGRRQFLLRSGALGSAGLTVAPGVGFAANASRDVSGEASRFGLSVLGFGADPSGIKDSTAAFQNAVAETAGGCLFVPRGRYRISKQIDIEEPSLVLVGESCRGERLAGSVLFKSDGFTGEALLKASGTPGNNLSGLSISGIAIDGRSQMGSGLMVERVGNAVLTALVVQANREWGIVVDGGFLCSLHGIASLGNGTFDKQARGGGVLFSSNSRESADCRIFDSYFNKNKGAQLRLTGTGGKSRVVGLTVYGGQFERPDHHDSLVPVVAVEAADRTTFFGCNFVQPKGLPAPCLGLGSVGTELNDVSFVSCYCQYNGKGAAIRALPGVRSVSFVDFRFNGRGKLFDFAAGLEKGSIFFSRPIDLTRGSGRSAISFPVMAGG